MTREILIRVTCVLAIAAAPGIFTASAAPPQVHPKAPAPAPAPQVSAPAPPDPLGRENPRSSMIGFLKSESRGDYTIAALYLQAPERGRTDLQARARQVQALRRNFTGDILRLSDQPDPPVEVGLPPGKVRAGTLQVGESSADVVLVRVNDPTGHKIWLISRETVESAATLYVLKEREVPPVLARYLPATLTQGDFLGMSPAEWLGWLVSIPISLLLASLAGLLLDWPWVLVCKIRKRQFRSISQWSIFKPLRYIIAITINILLIYFLLKPPLSYRVYYLGLMQGLLAGCFIWLLASITDRAFDRALDRAHTQSTGTESILRLTRRFLRIAFLMVGIVAILAAAGFHMGPAFAGLGIGGIGIALAAQKSLENVLGGVSLLMDKAVEVGNLCRIGDKVGVVEDVGLRSIRVRTLEQTLLIVPNGALAGMQFENLASRGKCLINQNFSLRIETDADQLRFVLSRVQTMLDQHPGIEAGTSRFRLSNFAGASYEMELWAYGKTGDWPQLTLIRQDVILKIAEIVADSGARFAGATQMLYLSSDAGSDLKKANDVVHRLADLGSSGSDGVAA